MGNDIKLAVFAKQCDEGDWYDFYHAFKKYEIKERELLDALPEDVLLPLVYLLGGEENTKAWINRPKKMLENKTPIELAQTEIGLKALKAFIMRMPN